MRFILLPFSLSLIASGFLHIDCSPFVAVDILTFFVVRSFPVYTPQRLFCSNFFGLFAGGGVVCDFDVIRVAVVWELSGGLEHKTPNGD